MTPVRTLLLGLVLCVLAATGARAHGPRQDAAQAYTVKLQALYRNLGVGGAAVDLIVDGRVQISTHADADGRVTFEDMAVERFEIVVREAGYFPRRVVFYNFTRKDIVDQIVMKKRIRWALSGTARGGGRLIQGAKVKLAVGADSQEETTTDAQGRFLFSDLYDTECQFTIEAQGFHRRLVWAANREQVDRHFDVELRPASERPSRDEDEAWRHGEPDRSVTARIVGGRADLAWAPERALVWLSYLERADPGWESPRGSVGRITLMCPFGARPRGALARVDQIVASWVTTYPRGAHLKPEKPDQLGRKNTLRPLGRKPR